jgi:hypothetical protein
MHHRPSYRAESPVAPVGELSTRLSWELVAWELVAALDAIGAWAPSWLTWVRAPVGIVATVMAPGYLLVPWLRPQPARQTDAEYWFLALLLSIAVTIALGLVYAYGGISLTAGNVALGQASVLTLEVGAATLSGRYQPLGLFARARRPATLMLGATIVALALTTLAVGRAALATRPALYLTNLRGHLEGFPYAVPYRTVAAIVVHVTAPPGDKLTLTERVNSQWVSSFPVSTASNGSWARVVRLPTAPVRRRMMVQFTLLGRGMTRTVWLHYWTGVAFP